MTIFEAIFQLCASPPPTISGQLDFFNFPQIYLPKLDQQKFGWLWLILSRVQSVSWSLAEFRHNKIVQSPHENYFNECRQHKEK